MTNGLKFEVLLDTLSNITYKDLHFACYVADGSGYLIYLWGMLPDNQTGVLSRQVGRKWYISDEATVSDIVRTAFLAVQTWEEHEQRETFLYKGVSVFSPHLNVEDLRQLSDQE